MIDTEVATLRTILLNCGSTKTCPSKYWLSLLDETASELDVDLKNQTITKSQFEILGTYSNIKYLNLKNIKITVSDTDTTIITNQDTINELVTDTLKNITNLKYVELDASSTTSLYNLDDISFIKGVDEDDSSDDIILNELDVMGTKVSTHRLSSDGITYETYDYGLILLEENRENLNTRYGANIVSLSVDESHIDLSEINSTVVCTLANASASWWNGNARRGLYSSSASILNTINNCSGLTKVNIGGGWPSGIVWDFSSQTSLISYASDWGISADIIFPSTCTSIKGDFSGNIDISRISSITTLNLLGTSFSKVVDILSSLGKNAVISTLYFRVNNTLSGEIDFSIFEEIYENRNEKITVYNLSLGYYSSFNGTVISLDGLEYLTGLQTLACSAGCLYNLSDINALLYHKDTLISVNIQEAKITDLSVFAILTNLQTLKLSGNPIANYTVNDDGNIVYNLKILAGLNGLKSGATGSLTQLYLEDCPSVTDWSDLTSLTWTTFKYGN